MTDEILAERVRSAATMALKIQIEPPPEMLSQIVSAWESQQRAEIPEDQAKNKGTSGVPDWLASTWWAPLLTAALLGALAYLSYRSLRSVPAPIPSQDQSTPADAATGHGQKDAASSVQPESADLASFMGRAVLVPIAWNGSGAPAGAGIAGRPVALILKLSRPSAASPPTALPAQLEIRLPKGIRFHSAKHPKVAALRALRLPLAWSQSRDTDLPVALIGEKAGSYRVELRYLSSDGKKLGQRDVPLQFKGGRN